MIKLTSPEAPDEELGFQSLKIKTTLAKKSAEGLDSEIKNFLERIRKQKQDFSNQINGLEDEINTLKTREEELLAQSTADKVKITELEASLEEKGNELIKEQQRSQDMQEESSTQFKGLEDEINTLKTREEELLAQIKAHEEQYKELEKSLEKKTTDLKKETLRVLELEDKLAQNES